MNLPWLDTLTHGGYHITGGYHFTNRFAWHLVIWYQSYQLTGGHQIILTLASSSPLVLPSIYLYYHSSHSLPLNCIVGVAWLEGVPPKTHVEATF